VVLVAVLAFEMLVPVYQLLGMGKTGSQVDSGKDGLGYLVFFGNRPTARAKFVISAGNTSPVLTQANGSDVQGSLNRA